MIIYKTTNLITGKIYVGKDAINNPTYLGSGLILRNAIKKYGITNFKKEILETCSSKEQLGKQEQYWIKTLNSTDRKKGYNIALGGTGGDTFKNLSLYKKKQRLIKLNASRKNWDTALHRLKQSETMKRLWANPNHKDHMSKVMRGREIKWANKISESIKEWHKTNKVPLESRQRAAAINKIKMTGKELVSISPELIVRMVAMYQTIGPKLIEQQLQQEGYNISRYLIIRCLKKEGIYKCFQKGIGEKSKKQCSISRIGQGNPMYKQLK